MAGGGEGTCVALGIHGKGAYMAGACMTGGMCGRGGHAWQGGVHDRGHACPPPPADTTRYGQ